MNRRIPHMKEKMNPKDSIKSLKKFSKYLNKYKLLIIIAIILGMISAIGNVIIPNLLARITKEFLNFEDNILLYGFDKAKNSMVNRIIRVSIIALSSMIISSVFNYLQNYILTIVTQKVSYNIRQDLDNKINKLPLKYFDTKQTGDILSRITNDVDTVSQTLSQGLSSFVISVTTIIGFIIIMLLSSWRLALVVFLTLPFNFISMTIIFKKSQKYFRRQAKSVGDLSGLIEEAYSNNLTIKAYNAEKEFESRFENINNEVCENSYKSQFLSNIMFPIMFFIGNIGYLLIALYGSYLNIKLGMGLEKIQEFIQYVRKFNQPINQLGQIFNLVQQMAASSNRIFEFLEEEDEDNTYLYDKLDNIKGEVVFENVFFSYTKDKTIIKNLNAHINPGMTIAIVGPTGAGKTTLVNLLMRFYDIDSGRILIDNYNINDVSKDGIRDLFGMVLQDTWLFKGTIKENIAYKDLALGKKIDMDRVIKVCKASQIHHFILSQPNGYDMLIDEEPDNISIGQKQLITIARAMYENSPMLILDEATSNVDTRTEILIQKALENLTRNKTSFIIAHRLSTIKDADLIFVVKDGNIIEQGNHIELIKQNGFYKELYESQFSD